MTDEVGDALQFYIVDSGFVHPEFSPDEMPLTVLYKDGEKVDTALFDPNATFELIQRAESLLGWNMYQSNVSHNIVPRRLNIITHDYHLC